MKKLFYEYSNGKYSIHTNFINNKTIKKEANGADRVSIYKCNEIELDKKLEGILSGEYITTLALS